MNLFVVAAVAIALGYDAAPLSGPPNVGLRLLAMFAGLTSVCALAAAVSAWASLSLSRNFNRRGILFGRYFRFRWIHSLLAVTVYLVIATHGGWIAIVRWEWNLDGWPLLDELLILAPYFLADSVCFLWFCLVDATHKRLLVANAIMEPIRPPPLWDRLLYHARTQYGIVLVAAFWLTGLRDLADYSIPQWRQSAETQAAASFVSLATMLALAPLAIRFVWKTEPLPKGGLRLRLEELSRRLGFRCAEILVWKTGGVANAAIAGFVPQLRYVFVTDAMLDQFTSEEICAVFSHEVGHVKRRHMTYYCVFLLLSVAVLTQLTELVGDWAARATAGLRWDWVHAIGARTPIEIGVMIGYFLVAFGFLSRQCEREADLFASRAVAATGGGRKAPKVKTAEELHPSSNGSGNGNGHAKGKRVVDIITPSSETPPASPMADGLLPPLTLLADGVDVFICALEKVALVNGMVRDGWDWRHGSIATRVEFLEAVALDPAVADRFDQRMRWLRAGLLIALIASFGLLLVMRQAA